MRRAIEITAIILLIILALYARTEFTSRYSLPAGPSPARLP